MKGNGKKSNGSLESVEINCIVSDFFSASLHSSSFVGLFVRKNPILNYTQTFVAPIKIVELIKFDNGGIKRNGIGKMKLKIKCAAESNNETAWSPT